MARKQKKRAVGIHLLKLGAALTGVTAIFGIPVINAAQRAASGNWQAAATYFPTDVQQYATQNAGIAIGSGVVILAHAPLRVAQRTRFLHVPRQWSLSW